jgi:uncharacterized membrane protein YkoI
MKVQLLAIVSALLLFAAACTQTSVDTNPATTASLASARIGAVTSSSATASSVSNGTCVRGGNVEVVITVAQLPATVLAYLTSNFAGYAIVQATQGTNRDATTYYEVKFTVSGTTRQLRFDMTGAVLTGGGRDGKGGRGGSTNTNEVIITQAQLPAAALTYLSTTYPGYVFVQAEKGTKSTGVVYYEVEFRTNGVKREVYFDAAGAVTK